MDEERKYLEGLLKDRFNFFIVFASLIVAGIVTADNISPKEEQFVYIAAIVVSFFIWVAVFRTNILVNRTLDKLPGDHPCKLITEDPIPLVPNLANSYLVVAAPLAIILLFLVLLLSTINKHGLLVFGA